MWAIVEDNDRDKTAITLTPSDVTSPLRAVLWDDRAFIVAPRTHIISVYEANRGGGVQYGKYGALVALEVNMAVGFT